MEKHIVLPVTNSPLYNFYNGFPRSPSPCPCGSNECMKEYAEEMKAMEAFKQKVRSAVEALKSSASPA